MILLICFFLERTPILALAPVLKIRLERTYTHECSIEIGRFVDQIPRLPSVARNHCPLIELIECSIRPLRNFEFELWNYHRCT